MRKKTRKVAPRADDGWEALPGQETPVPVSGEGAGLAAAWDTAVAVNRLNRELQIGLLRPDELDIRTHRARISVDRLAVQARELVEPVAEKDALMNAVRSAWSGSDFDDVRYAALHGQTEALHREAEHKLRDRRGDYDAFFEAHEEMGRAVVEPCRRLIGEIDRALEQAMTEDQRRAYRLSLMLERVTDREDVYGGTFIWYPPDEDGGTYEPPGYFAAVAPRPSDWSPPRFRLDELKDRLRDCGFDESFGPPGDDLWVPGGRNRLVARMRADGLEAFDPSKAAGVYSVNWNLGRYQLGVFKGRVRRALASGGAPTSSAGSGARDEPVRPTCSRVTISKSGTCWALRADDDGRPLSIPHALGVFFGLFVVKVAHGNPNEIVKWAELNRESALDRVYDPEGNDVETKVASQETRHNKKCLNELLRGRWATPDQAPWIGTRKGDGAYLNGGVRWEIDESLKVVFRRATQSVNARPTDPRTMAGNTPG
jgi:hypothetical protein